MIHETAVVEEGASIGPRTKVWHHAQIRSGAHVGADCIIGKGVYIGPDVRIGNKVKIQNYACIYGPCTVQDEVFIGPHAIITNDKWPRSTTELGELITDWETMPVTIDFRASIGAGAIILPGRYIGREAMVGAGAVVTRDVEPRKLVIGVPATVWRDITGE